MSQKLRVYWFPQIGASGEPFYVPVQSVEEGKRVMDMLAAYDAYQLQHNIKPDYSNIGGLEVYNPETKEYEDWFIETEGNYFDDVDEYLEFVGKTAETDTFKTKLFEQIDWELINNLID